jgi:hypothetical protein
MLPWRIASPSLLELRHSENLSNDARTLLAVCNTLRNRRSRETCLDESTSLENDVCAYVEDILPSLSYGTILMLALMTWHFNASSSKASQGFIIFLRRPYNSEVKRILQERYQRMMCETGSPNFDFLLVLN